MKEFAVCGIGNAIVDLFVGVTDEEFATLGFERGTMRLVEADEQKDILKQFHERVPRLVSGGSVANSVIGFSQLGGKAAFIGIVGDDRYGLHYQEEFQQLGIDMGNPILVDQTTGTCACVITPDAERTMRTCLAVNGQLSGAHVDADRVAKSEWLFVEGYLLANPGTGQEAVAEAIRVAKKNGVKVALTCSEAFIVHVFGDAFFKTLSNSDFLFSNASEAMAITKTDSAKTAFAKLKDLVPGCVVTDGPHGAYIRYQGVETHVDAYPCTPKDLTGAGDMFAGSFLYGITQGLAPDAAGRGANFLAMKVISQVGARLHSGAKEFWSEATGGK
ncbi:adenosine kinase [Zavarzinella formosa]|uniref:adenosine kinase n=1 Tax=Zavarzinella formosa TaxID=360055 RepID=UPI0002FE9BB7|nr:adenosine kinase [Zavarzinella formosa]